MASRNDVEPRTGEAWVIRHARRDLLAADAAMATLPAAAQEKPPHGLKPGTPYKGQTALIHTVATPQFDALRLRAAESAELTGVETNWGAVPFTVLRDKLTSIGVAADGTYGVVNYFDSWGRSNAAWFAPLDGHHREGPHGVTEGIGLQRAHSCRPSATS